MKFPRSLSSAAQLRVRGTISRHRVYSIAFAEFCPYGDLASSNFCNARLLYTLMRSLRILWLLYCLEIYRNTFPRFLVLRVHSICPTWRGGIGLHSSNIWGQLKERRAPASVAQWSELSSRKREVRGWIPRRVTSCRFLYWVRLHLFIYLKVLTCNTRSVEGVKYYRYITTYT